MRADLLPTTYEDGLIRVVQEASEVIQAVTKLQLFGETATDHVTKRNYDNVRALLFEFNDLEHAMACIKRALAKRGFAVTAAPTAITDFHPNLADPLPLCQCTCGRWSLCDLD